MRTFSRDDLQELFYEITSDSEPCEMEVDSDGQLVINTGIYRWSDDTYHDEKEVL